MAEPLSIAASITGMLDVSARIFMAISEFMSSVADAPNSARYALAAVEEARLALVCMKMLIDRLSAFPRNRKAMIQLKHLVIAFRESVLTFSELEAVVTKSIDWQNSIWSRMQWVAHEKDIERLIKRLESHKASFSLMMSILQCESDNDAKESLRGLEQTVQTLLDQNHDLLRRLEQIDAIRQNDNSSLRFFEEDQSYSGVSENWSDHLSGFESPIRREFEHVLQRSRVYARVQNNSCDLSFTTSIPNTHAWSMLSGITLSDISNISVIALPITFEEIKTFGGNLSFARNIPAISIDKGLDLSEYKSNNFAEVVAERKIADGLRRYECPFCREFGISMPIGRLHDVKLHFHMFHGSNALWICKFRISGGCNLFFDFHAAYKAHMKKFHAGLGNSDDKVNICEQVVFACGFDNCHEVFEASDNSNGSDTRRVYFEHILNHMKSSDSASWTYSKRIHNLLGQEQLLITWKDYQAVRNGHSENRGRELELSWQPQTTGILRKMLECRHIPDPGLLCRYAALLGGSESTIPPPSGFTIPVLDACTCTVSRDIRKDKELPQDERFIYLPSRSGR